jgi:hypothetical protein
MKTLPDQIKYNLAERIILCYNKVDDFFFTFVHKKKKYSSFECESKIATKILEEIGQILDEAFRLAPLPYINIGDTTCAIYIR